jgi:hypothetical protein
MRPVMQLALAALLVVAPAAFAQIQTQTPAPSSKMPTESPLPGKTTATPEESKAAAAKAAAKTDSLPSPGEDLDPHIKKGSEDDVNAVGDRNIGGRGMGNWYSTDWEVRTGKQYSMEI